MTNCVVKHWIYYLAEEFTLLLSQSTNVNMCCVTDILGHYKNKTQSLTDRYSLEMNADNNDYKYL